MKPYSYQTLEKFVGSASAFYVLKWKVAVVTGSNISWNWAAFCFGVFWLAYRKMYRHMLLFTALLFSMVLFNGSSALSRLIGFTVTYYYPLVLGLFGNYLYYRHVVQQVSKLQQRLGDESVPEDVLVRQGGTDYRGVVLLVLVAAAVALLLSANV